MGRLRNGIKGTQILQPPASGDHRLSFAADDGTEIIKRPFQRIDAFNCNRFAAERLIPTPFRLIGVEVGLRMLQIPGVFSQRNRDREMFATELWRRESNCN